MGFRVQDLGFRLEGWGLGFRVQDLGFRVEGAGLGVEGLGFRTPDATRRDLLEGVEFGV